MTYREKLRQLSEKLKTRGEEDLIKDVDETIRMCGHYVQKVINMEAAFIAADLYKELKECREIVRKLDEYRHHTHEALISYVKMMNKFCEMAGVESIYQGNIHNRVEIGNFALEVTAELFDTRKFS